MGARADELSLGQDLLAARASGRVSEHKNDWEIMRVPKRSAVKSTWDLVFEVPSRRRFPCHPSGLAFPIPNVPNTLTHQNLLFCRFPIDSILPFIIGPYKRWVLVGEGSEKGAFTMDTR